MNCKSLLLAIVLTVLTALTASAATRVPLILDEKQPRSVPWPITTAVPFPVGKLKAIENCRLVDDQGKEQILQAKVVSRWLPAEGIRWLTIDFVAQPRRQYQLEFGDDIKTQKFESPLRIEQKDQVRVSTGALSASFSKKGAFALDNVRLEPKGGRDAEGVGESYCIDSQGQRASSVKDGDDRQIVVESTGPMRGCVRVDGYYTGPDGKRTIAYRSRYHFFAGFGLVKVVNEFRIVESTKGIRWRDVGFSMRLPLDRKTWKVAVDGSGELGNQVVRIKPAAEAKSISSFQATYRHYGNPECRGAIVESLGNEEKEIHKTEQIGEWLQVSDNKIAVTGSMRWFWQQFPAEWQASPEGITLHLWSPRGGELDFSGKGIKDFFGEAGEKYLLDWKGVRPAQTPIERFFYNAGRPALERGDVDGLGINKHHEFFLHFAPADRANVGQEYGRLAAEPPLALASGAWNAATDVMGPIAPRPNDSPYEAIVDRLFDMSRTMQDTFGDYGWFLFGAGPHYSYQWDPNTGKHYADPRRFEFHTYQRETQHWWNYLRSGERKFLDWALPSENHWIDIAVSHRPTQFFAEYRGGSKAPATLPWPKGDWSIDSSMHFLRHHDTGEAWLRGQSQFWASYHRTLETTTLAYYLTGDERFNDVLEYWRSYYGDLAGKTSDSKDFQPWHRSQAWYRPTPTGEKPKTRAEMIRDYAPFNSGSRHQLTLFFNLATLYEHTQDPKIAQALREYADAFLDPAHPIGVWRSQDNQGPVHAEAPIMCHYWAPALWRYARATNDPRMPEVFRRYFAACLGADPFQEDVGIYSNNQIGYAYAFSKDPRHLRAAVAELEHLRPFAEPLARPEDLNARLYNPYAPIRSFTAVPRLIWALQEAKRNRVSVPPPAITRPQRAPLAVKKKADATLEMVLWGYDSAVHLTGPDGKSLDNLQVESKTFASALQPFDRILPKHQVYQHRVTLPASAPAGWYSLKPKLEIAILELHGGEGAWCDASEPVAIHPGVVWHWKVPAKAGEWQIDSSLQKNIRIVGANRINERPDGFTLSFTPADEGKTIRFENASASVVWLRLRGGADEQIWIATKPEILDDKPTAPARPKAVERSNDRFVQGRFGKGLQVAGGETLQLPDHQVLDGMTRRFFDLKIGTLELWVKIQYDERVTPVGRFNFLSNGLIDAWSPWKLPLDEWAHVALVWRPDGKNPPETMLHIYVNGLDQANYRSRYWEGYGGSYSLRPSGKWLEGFIAKPPPGISFALDELRISSVPRYADLQVEFGGQQTFNPHRFEPPSEPFRPDRDTLLLFHFDGDLRNQPAEGQAAVEGRWVLPKKK